MIKRNISAEVTTKSDNQLQVTANQVGNCVAVTANQFFQPSANCYLVPKIWNNLPLDIELSLLFILYNTALKSPFQFTFITVHAIQNVSIVTESLFKNIALMNFLFNFQINFGE